MGMLFNFRVLRFRDIFLVCYFVFFFLSWFFVEVCEDKKFGRRGIESNINTLIIMRMVTITKMDA